MSTADFEKIMEEIKKKRDGTSTLLVQDLEEHLKTITGDDDEDVNDRENILGLIEECKELWYDDYASERATPKLDLIKFLKKLPNVEHIIKNVENGKYD